jgi:hypothetical protein
MDDESPLQRPARRGFSLFYRGKTLLSGFDPVSQAERLVENLPPEEKTLYFVPSPLYGYGLDRLKRRITGDSAILCVEADAQLRAIAQKALENDVSPEPRLVLAETAGAESICALIRRVWGPRRFRRVRTLRLTGGWQLAERLYAEMEAALQAEIAGDWGNALTLVRLGRRFILNFIRNLALIPRAERGTAAPLGSAPALILGAGPSLDGLLDALAARFPDLSRPAARPFRIAVVDTALRCLLGRNIVPDLVIALESQHWNLRDFTGTGNRAIPIAMDLSALPATADVLSGGLSLFFTPWTNLRLFARLAGASLLPPEVPPLGSVGLTAAALALHLGSGPALTGGLDFSFTIEKFHARGSPGSDESLRRTTRLRSPISGQTAFRAGNGWTRSKQGGPVLSGGALKKYRDLFEREFAGETRLRDISSSGLYLGIPVLEMDAALDLLERGGPSPAASAAVPYDGAADGARRREVLAAFMAQDGVRLAELRDILTGAARPGLERLETLLDACDYIWAHFPDCAGAEGRRPAPADGGVWTGFLKRVRVELDPFIRQWELSQQELSQQKLRHYPV